MKRIVIALIVFFMMISNVMAVDMCYQNQANVTVDCGIGSGEGYYTPSTNFTDGNYTTYYNHKLGDNTWIEGIWIPPIGAIGGTFTFDYHFECDGDPDIRFTRSNDIGTITSGIVNVTFYNTTPQPSKEEIEGFINGVSIFNERYARGCIGVTLNALYEEHINWTMEPVYNITFNESTDYKVYYVNETVLVGTGTEIIIENSEATLPFTEIRYNNEEQVYQFRPSSNDDYHNQIYLSIENEADIEINAVVYDGYEFIEYARVEVREQYTDSIINAKVTNKNGETTVKVADNRTYRVCAYRESYDQGTDACKVVSSDESGELGLVTLRINQSITQIDLSEVNGTVLTNDGKRVNFSLVESALDSRTDYNVFNVIIIFLALVIGIVAENRVSGWGMYGFGITLAMFSQYNLLFVVPITLFMGLPWILKKVTGVKSG